MNFNIEKGHKRTYKSIKYPLNELFLYAIVKSIFYFKPIIMNHFAEQTYRNELTGDAEVYYYESE